MLILFRKLNENRTILLIHAAPSYCDPKTVVTKFPNWTKIKCEKLAAC